jgi:hypothetical protein
MINSVILSDSDIFCGDSFVLTIDKFDSVDIEISGSKLFINKFFVKNFDNKEEAKEAVKPLISSLENEDIDFEYDN